MKRILMTVAIATAFTASPTMAATFSSASLSNFQVSLVDLDLNDGITPSITFGPFTRSALGGGAFISGSGSGQTFSHAQNWGTISPTSETVTTPTNTASASISGDSVANRALQVSGSSQSSSGDGYNFGYGSEVFDTIYFTLSSAAQLHVTADAHHYVERTANTTDTRESASSYASMIVYWNDIGDDSSAISVSSGTGDTPFKLSELMLLSVVLDNTRYQQFTGFIQSHISNGGFSSYEAVQTGPAAVPVPAALPLMASALGLFGLGAKRRKALKA